MHSYGKPWSEQHGTIQCFQRSLAIFTGLQRDVRQRALLESQIPQAFPSRHVGPRIRQEVKRASTDPHDHWLSRSLTAPARYRWKHQGRVHVPDSSSSRSKRQQRKAKCLQLLARHPHLQNCALQDRRRLPLRQVLRRLSRHWLFG